MSGTELKRLKELTSKLQNHTISGNEIEEYRDLSFKSFKETYDKYTG